MGRRMRPRYLPADAMMASSKNQKARADHLGRASQPPPVHPRLEVGGAMLRAIQRRPTAEVAGNGVPERIRTSDLRFRKPLLYPAELRGHGQTTSKIGRSCQGFPEVAR